MAIFKKLTVLSLEQATVLPYLTYRLAHDGMNVIRLEHPVYGDPNRFIGENVLNEERMNAYFLCINAGKKALTLNLAEEAGQKIFHALIKELDVDIFATNQLPRNYQKLGIDYETIKALKPDIIWLGITGFGPQPQRQPLPGQDGMRRIVGGPTTLIDTLARRIGDSNIRTSSPSGQGAGGRDCQLVPRSWEW